MFTNFLGNLTGNLQKLKWSHVFMLFFMCLILLISFYSYRKIESIDFLIKNSNITPAEKFFLEFGFSSLESDLLIREIIVSTRTRLKADNVSLWGYHNGVSIGPFPFKKKSVIDESVPVGTERLAESYQNVPLNLYVRMSSAVWQSPSGISFIASTELKEEDNDTYWFLESNGFYYMYAYPIILSDYPSPIGMLTVALRRSTYERLIAEDALINFEVQVILAGERIEGVFNLKYHQLLNQLDGQ